MDAGTYSNGLTNYYLFLKVALPASVAVATFLLLTLLLRSRNIIKQGEWSIVQSLSRNKTFRERVEALILAAGFEEILDFSRLLQVVVFVFSLAFLPFVLTGQPAGAIIAAVVAVAVPFGTLYYVKGRRQALIEDQLMSFFNEMAARMKTHEDPQTAFLTSIDSTEAPLRHILVRVERNIRDLKSFPEALVKSRESIPSGYYQDFIDAVQISYDTGGPLQDIIENVIQHINDKKVSLRKLRAAISAINLQMVVIFISPPLLSWMMTIQNPDAGRILFGTFAGYVILGVVGVIYAAAGGFAFWVKNYVTRKVS